MFVICIQASSYLKIFHLQVELHSFKCRLDTEKSGFRQGMIKLLKQLFMLYTFKLKIVRRTGHSNLHFFTCKIMKKSKRFLGQM